ncbi:hypothetical protein SB861_52305 [Paraburkholderia sp. SIMBA_049]
MLESLHVISGLQNGTFAESLLLDRLKAAGIQLPVAPTEFSKLPFATLRPQIHLLFVFPILGDNDVTDEMLDLLHRFVSMGRCLGRAVIVVLTGDRHISDELVSESLPIHIKLNNAFRRAGAFHIIRSKLDQHTAPSIADEIVALSNKISFDDIEQIEHLTELLGVRPTWDPTRRLLDFYDRSTGFSLLRAQTSSTLTRAAQFVTKLAPETLLVAGGGLNDERLSCLASAFTAETIDLGSNRLNFEATASLLGCCRWLSLAANRMVNANPSLLPASIEQLYLQKNMLRELVVSHQCPATLKVISVYRNNLAHLEWPSDQTAIARLNLGANPVDRLPENLATASKLQTLGLARTGLKRLPDWIFHLPSLREIDISYIEDALPRPQLRKLREMHVSLITRPGYVESQ